MSTNPFNDNEDGENVDIDEVEDFMRKYDGFYEYAHYFRSSSLCEELKSECLQKFQKSIFDVSQKQFDAYRKASSSNDDWINLLIMYRIEFNFSRCNVQETPIEAIIQPLDKNRQQKLSKNRH